MIIIARRGHLGGCVVRRGLLLAALILSALLHAAPAQSQKPAPRALLQKVSDAYYKLKSYEGKASVEVDWLYRGSALNHTIDQVEITLQRPNKLRLYFVNPGGSREIIADGVTFTFYNAKLNQYAKMPAAPSLSGLVDQLGSVGVQALGDPFYFLTVKGVPHSLTALRSLGAQKLNGKPVYVVSGASPVPARIVGDKDGRRITMPASKTVYKWWINKKSFLLEKIEALDANRRIPAAIQNGRKQTTSLLSVTQKMRHIVLTAKPNAPLTDRAFAFDPPAGATERKSMRELAQP